MAGAASDQRHAGFAGEARMRVGHVHTSGFVARVDQPDAALEQRIEQRHDVVARERIDGVDACALQGVDQHVGTAMLVHE